MEEVNLISIDFIRQFYYYLSGHWNEEKNSFDYIKDPNYSFASSIIMFILIFPVLMVNILWALIVDISGVVLILFSEADAYKPIFDDDINNKITTIEKSIFHSGFWTLRYSERKYRNNIKVAIAAVSRDGREYQYLTNRLKKDIYILELAIQTYPDAITYAHPKLKKIYNKVTPF